MTTCTGVGAIPPIAEQQAMLWTLILLGKVPTPISPPHYRLLQNPSGRITYGVDHGACVYLPRAGAFS